MDFVTERECKLKHSVQQILLLCSEESNIDLVDSLAEELILRYEKNFNKRYFPDSQVGVEVFLLGILAKFY